MQRALLLLTVAFTLAGPAAAVAGPPAPQVQAAAGAEALDRLVGATIRSVRVVSQGVAVRDPQVEGLLELKVGDALSPVVIRRTIVHLMGLGTYLDVLVSAEAADGGAAVVVDLVPLREVARLVFKGDTGLSERVLHDAVSLRFGSQPPLGRAVDIARTLEEVYADYGYLRAAVQPRPLDAPGAEPGDMVFDVAPGTRATLREVVVRGAPAAAVAAVRSGLNLRDGGAYEPLDLRQRLAGYVRDFRQQGYLEARVDPFARVNDTGDQVDLTVVVSRGAIVRVEFAGDPLPASQLDTLVPVAREGSADEDLLEDSQDRIEQYLRQRGYRDARAPFTRTETGERLTIVFTVNRGLLHRVAGVNVATDEPGGMSTLSSALTMKPGEPFVQARLDGEVSVILDSLRRRGYTRATVRPTTTTAPGRAGSNDALVNVVFRVDAGPRAAVSRIHVEGARALPESVLRANAECLVGSAYYRPLVERDRDRIEAAYRDRGYREAVVDAAVTLSETGTDADVVFQVREGPQVLVDRILVVGNTRTSEETIRREIVLKRGAALGDAAVAESQQRLATLGLFRRSTISELPHTNANVRDVLVTVEEAPATSLGYGGGFEFQKVETIEFAPRGFVELGRRNLWGKNRSLNLFSRVSIRRQNTGAGDDGTDQAETNLEYRVIGSYREPRIAHTPADLQMAVVLEQGSRTSFRYRHESARLDLVMRRSSSWRYIGQFAVERNDIFDDRINPVDRPLIDRLFPQVRLSSISVTTARDTRNDPIEPVRGQLVSLNGELALRQFGSQVGYAKSYLQAFAYQRVPGASRLVLAGGVRVGLGTGFARTVTVTDTTGASVVQELRDLPISKRFFAGGDTSVRAFDRDHLGTAGVFDRDGTPIGGHAEIVLNAEGRLAVWKDLGVVGFVDTGNVFATVDELDPGKLRVGAGLGLRYKSPIGPLRFDLGWKLGRLRTFGTEREQRLAWHINIGQAF